MKDTFFNQFIKLGGVFRWKDNPKKGNLLLHLVWYNLDVRPTRLPPKFLVPVSFASLSLPILKKKRPLKT